jgi:TPR repeat protein
MAIQYFIHSAESGHPDSQAVVGWMEENAIGRSVDISAPAQYYELSANHSKMCALTSLGAAKTDKEFRLISRSRLSSF